MQERCHDAIEGLARFQRRRFRVVAMPPKRRRKSIRLPACRASRGLYVLVAALNAVVGPR
jgi:hypothetical protein